MEGGEGGNTSTERRPREEEGFLRFFFSS